MAGLLAFLIKSYGQCLNKYLFIWLLTLMSCLISQKTLAVFVSLSTLCLEQALNLYLGVLRHPVRYVLIHKQYLKLKLSFLRGESQDSTR